MTAKQHFHLRDGHPASHGLCEGERMENLQKEKRATPQLPASTPGSSRPFKRAATQTWLVQRQLVIRGLLVASKLGAAGAFPKKLLARAMEPERYLQAVSCGSPPVHGDSSHRVARGTDVPATPPARWLPAPRLRSAYPLCVTAPRNRSAAIPLGNNSSSVKRLPLLCFWRLLLAEAWANTSMLRFPRCSRSSWEAHRQIFHFCWNLTVGGVCGGPGGVRRRSSGCPSSAHPGPVSRLLQSCISRRFPRKHRTPASHVWHIWAATEPQRARTAAAASSQRNANYCLSISNCDL